MDKLEKFVSKRRAEFDSADPPNRIWEGIQARLPEGKARRIGLWKYVAVAAVGLVFILSGVVTGMYLNRPVSQGVAGIEEYNEAERFFNAQINQRLQLLSSYQYDSSVEEDLRSLDEAYSELQEELTNSNHPNRQQIIDAMILNYQTRISILERVLDKMSVQDSTEIKKAEFNGRSEI